jgi:translation initiation factor 3 subunit B
MRAWLQDPDCNDQYSVISEAGDKVCIYWNSMPEPTVVEERTRWTEAYVQWSPMGTYFATIHRMGVALWGAEKFQRIVRFEQAGVQFIHFSPNEK